MKDVLCPVCNTRGIPFWKAFWSYFKVDCTACGTTLRHSRWTPLLYIFVLQIPVAIIMVGLVIIPYVGWLLVILLIFAIMWAQTRWVKRVPVKRKK